MTDQKKTERMMKKVVLQLEYHDEKIKQKAMKTVSGLKGVDGVVLDTKDKKLTVTGSMDPFSAVAKLRKICSTEIDTVGPAAKEPAEKKKEEPKKEKEEPKPKKEEPKKEKEEPKPKKEEPKKEKEEPKPKKEEPNLTVEDHPSSCVIC